jgi:hypothetical protein
MRSENYFQVLAHFLMFWKTLLCILNFSHIFSSFGTLLITFSTFATHSHVLEYSLVLFQFLAHFQYLLNFWCIFLSFVRIFSNLSTSDTFSEISAHFHKNLYTFVQRISYLHVLADFSTTVHTFAQICALSLNLAHFY